MSVQIGICDDRLDDIRILSEALYAYDVTFQITAYSEGQSLLEDCFERKILFDIIFLDIYMPDLNGIDTAKKIRSVMKDVKIVFVSSSNEHYPEAYDLFAFNYILKPINIEKLNRVLEQALSDISGERLQQISFSHKGSMHRIYCRDILYIESRDKLILFNSIDGTTKQCYAKIDDILNQLPDESFIRCHQSFVVNIYHVTEMSENSFRVGSSNISISKKYLKASKDKYFKYLFSHMNYRG